VSSIYTSIGDAPKSFREAKSALRYKLLLGKGKVINYADVIRDIKNDIMIPVSVWKRLENSLITGDDENIPDVVTELFKELKRLKDVDPAEILLKCREELLIIRRNLEDIGLDDSSIKSFIDKYDLGMYGLTLDELEEQFREVFQNLAKKIFRSNSLGIKAVINQIKQYIDQNYTKSISLNTISEKFYINSSYASRLFKQELSENFVDYLTGKRMAEAAKLLQSTEMTIYEISEKIGYGNSKYFSQLFKKHTGFSPRDYREQNVK
jgi:two-component system response regulator YesN